jgi:hypothetical protein
MRTARRATGSGLDFLQQFPQVHFRHPLWPNRCDLCSTLLTDCEMALEGIVSPDWLKMKNPSYAAVTREAEDDWAR